MCRLHVGNSIGRRSGYSLMELLVESGTVQENVMVERLDQALDKLEQEERAREEQARETKAAGDPFTIAPRR